MAFDINTAKPESQKKKGFDLSSAKPAATSSDVPITGFNGEQIPWVPAEPYKEPPRVIQSTGIDAAIGSTPVIGGAYEYAKTITPEPVKNFLSSAVSGGADVVQTGAAMLSGIGSDILGKATAIPHAFYGDKVPEDVYQGVVDANQYLPTRQGAMQNLQAIGDLLQPLESLPPVLGAGVPQMNAIARTASISPEIPAKIRSDLSSGINEVRSIANKQESDTKSMGAAQSDVAQMRRESAAQLPVDPMLTEGQATRDFNQIRFEQEAAKGELGDPLRQRAAFQHQAIQQSIDSWIDETEAAAPDIRSVGASVDSALKRLSVTEKAKIRSAYREAEVSGEMLEPIRTDGIVSALNDMSSAESTAPVITAAKRELVKLGGAELDESGNLTPKDLTLKDAEQLRKFVNKTTGADPTNINFASEIKSAIDSTTEGSGGDVYRKARRMREEYARKFEDRAIVADLVNTKRGTADRKVALEDVFDRIAFRGSLDDVRFMRRMLQGAGEEGNQAWKEVQGAGLKYIRDEATKNVARDVNGNPMVSPAGLNRAITRLDTDGKLDFMYGKNGANKIRAINDISKVLFTAPPGAVNTSNTASVLLAGLDIMVSGASGMPLPIASGIRLAAKNVKDRKLKARIMKALGDYEKAP